MASDASLTAAQITSMQACVASSMKDTCDIIRKTTTPNGAGGSTATFAVVHSNVPVIFGPFRVPFLKELEVDNTREDAKSRWQAAFPIGTDVQINDRLLMHNGGLTYEVASHRSPQTFSLYVYYLLEQVD